MDVASFVLIILGIISYALFLFRLIVIYPKIYQEGSVIEKVVHALRTAFLFSFGTRVFVTVRFFTDSVGARAYSEHAPRALIPYLRSVSP